MAHLKDGVSYVVYLHHGGVALAELGGKHLLETRRGVHQDDLVRVEHAPLHPAETRNKNMFLTVFQSNNNIKISKRDPLPSQGHKIKL